MCLCIVDDFVFNIKSCNIPSLLTHLYDIITHEQLIMDFPLNNNSQKFHVFQLSSTLKACSKCSNKTHLVYCFSLTHYSNGVNTSINFLTWKIWCTCMSAHCNRNVPVIQVNEYLALQGINCLKTKENSKITFPSLCTKKSYLKGYYSNIFSKKYLIIGIIMQPKFLEYMHLLAQKNRCVCTNVTYLSFEMTKP